jgi:hypothetical protein
MNRNHIDDRWRQCHWAEWREIKKRWNQVRKTGEEPNRHSERVRAAERERRAQLSPKVEPGSNLQTSALGLAAILSALPFPQK